MYNGSPIKITRSSTSLNMALNVFTCFLTFAFFSVDIAIFPPSAKVRLEADLTYQFYYCISNNPLS